VLTQFLGQHPNADSQQLRQWQRNAKKELAAEKPPKSARLLYKYVKSLLEA
jgi:ribosome-associated protein